MPSINLFTQILISFTYVIILKISKVQKFELPKLSRHIVITIMYLVRVCLKFFNIVYGFIDSSPKIDTI